MEAIRYDILAAAIEHYSNHGYELIETPWTVSSLAYAVTRPDRSTDIVTKAQIFSEKPIFEEQKLGHPVASGEQGFIQMMIDGRLQPGRWMTVTPCFRIEQEYNELRRPSFMKLELIQYPGLTREGLESVVFGAETFMQKYVDCQRVTMSDGSIDIETTNSIELGSYGIRQFEHDAQVHSWIYGTGVALPRLQVAMASVR